MTTLDKLAAIRQLMQQNGLSAYIVFGNDPHASEYMAEHWYEPTWLSGFKGETGNLLILKDKAFLWTDSRYYLQAEKELAGSTFELMRESEVDTPTIPEYLAANLSEGEIVGFNAEMLSVEGFLALQAEIATAGLKTASIDLIAPLWVEGRPAIPQAPFYIHDEKYAGESVESKLARVREAMQQKKTDTLLISALDEIAWLLNIRGNDIECTPVVIAYCILTLTDCTLFVAPQKLTEETRAYLAEHHISLQDYTDIHKAVAALSPCASVLYDPARLNQSLFEAIPDGCKKVAALSPIVLIKSQKNEVQLAGTRRAMQADCLALIRFFIWLEKEMEAQANSTFNFQHSTLTEWTLMEKLQSFRAMDKNYVEDSFLTIAGFNANGAIVHYAATPTDCATVTPNGILLLDSGGQYLDGTTDITRTISLDGKPTAQMKRDFTLVLKGHIALAKAIFPRGTRGNQLDVLARQFLWQNGLHYGHGTGHGVGHFLGCHEGPQNIRTDNNPAPLQIGNICSDEPGLYRAGEYGIRIENLIAVKPCVFASSRETSPEFYCFETLTLCPYDTRLLDYSILTDEELEWIDDYHAWVLETMLPVLENEEEKAWLKDHCAPIMELPF